MARDSRAVTLLSFPDLPVTRDRLLTGSECRAIISVTDISITDILSACRKGFMPRDTHAIKELLPLTPAVFHILLALADGERHGYSIMQEIECRTAGRTKLGPGTLYGSIKRMLAEGLIEESEERPDPALDDVRRRYYRLTGLGRRAAVAEAERLQDLVHEASAKQLLRI